MTLNKRLDKVEKSLTPKQTVVLWLQEIEQYRNAEEYLRYLRSQPESAAPITRLTRQIDEGIRVAMKGQPKEAISAAVRRSVRDVVFLVKLHLQVNFKIMSELRQWRLSQIALSECLGKLHTEVVLRNRIVDTADLVNFGTPYPLDPETAAAVDVAVHNHVYTWEALNEESIIQDWLWYYLIDKGAKELPLNSCAYPDGQYCPTVTRENEKEVRDCFQDDSQFEKFKSGEDYTHGLAGVTDAECDTHYETIVNALEELMNSGQVQKGLIVRLETIPIHFLRDVPLIKGQWLNRHLVELAEWGALLKTKGYQVQENEDAHALALDHFIRSDAEKPDPAEIQDLRRKMGRNLTKFPGRTLKIEDQMFIYFEDYRTWRGRKVKGDLRKQVKEGLVTESWNKWVSDHGGDGIATVAGVKVNEFHCYIDECSYYSSPGNIEKQLQQREQLLDGIRLSRFKPDNKENLIEEWKKAVAYCLVELYAFRQAVVFIQKSYFEGQPVLFPDVAKDLSDIITEAETTVNNFNGSFPEVIELYKTIDLEVLRQNANKEANQLIAYIVDMAKAEALDCLGDEQAAVKQAHALDAMGEEVAATQIVERYL